MTGELSALHGSVDRLAGIVAGLGPDQLRLPAYPSEWSVADTLSHMGSGAVIMQRGVEDVLEGRPPADGFNQRVWDEWNAKDPDAQAADLLVADAALMATLDAVDEEQRAAFRFALGPFDLDFAGAVGLRLGEHALHTWDTEVATVDPSAVVPEDAAAVVVDNLARIAGFAGQPTGVERTVVVATTAPSRSFTVTLTPDAVALVPGEAAGPADVELPAESFVRLVYGRLDPDHSAAVADSEALDELRRVFPGF
jgi:uncharacterized protein (TIGR03083 family)